MGQLRNNCSSKTCSALREQEKEYDAKFCFCYQFRKDNMLLPLRLLCSKVSSGNAARSSTRTIAVGDEELMAIL